MRATEVLSAHHDELRALLTRPGGLPVERADERQQVLDRLVDELSLHEQLEDEIFYPSVTAAGPMVAVAHAEHRYLEDQVAVVVRTGPRGVGFAEEVRVLHEAVEHHAGHEESEMFTEVDAKLDGEAVEDTGARISARLARRRASRTTRLRVRREVLRRTPGGAPRAGHAGPADARPAPGQRCCRRGSRRRSTAAQERAAARSCSRVRSSRARTAVGREDRSYGGAAGAGLVVVTTRYRRAVPGA